jgi:methylmalonyl-CoA/ethylmalonyl-CoA epimerase
MILRVDHIGIAAHNRERFIELFKSLGFALQMEGIAETYGVRCSFISLGNVDVELVDPVSENNPLVDFLDSHGDGLHHLAFEVDNLEAEIKDFEARGYQMINPAKVQSAKTNMKVAFVSPLSTKGLLIVLVEYE